VLAAQFRSIRHEHQGDELGEAAGFLLQVAQQAEVLGNVAGRLHVTEEHGRGASDAHAMGGAHHVEPLVGREFAGTDLPSHTVDQNFGGGAAQAAEPRFDEPFEGLFDAQPGPAGVPVDLHRTEGVEVRMGQGLVQRPDHVDQKLEVEPGVESALQADFVHLRRPEGHADDFVDGHRLGVGVAFVATVGAERAVGVADVGEVDVAVVDVRDAVAVDAAVEPIGGGEDVAACLGRRAEQPGGVVARQQFVAKWLIENSGQRSHDAIHCQGPPPATRATARLIARLPILYCTVLGSGTQLHLDAQSLSDFLAEYLNLEGLEQGGLETFFAGPDDRVRRIVPERRHQDNRQLRAFLADLGEDLVAVLVRHPDVRQQEIVWVFFGQVHGFLPVGGQIDRGPEITENL